MNKRKKLYIKGHDGDWRRSVEELLDSANFGQTDIGEKSVVMVKPNLVEALPPPITTPVELVEAVIDSLGARLPGVEIIVGEGTGANEYETDRAFEELGYSEMAKRKAVRLVDLNHAPLIELKSSSARRWSSFYLPKIVMESYILSVPVLKAHSLAGVTLTMKNMMGAVPPLHYQAGGHWKKSAFHSMMQESVLDLNHYRAPDFTILDATVGMSQAHLWGPKCDPPPGLVVAGFDPVMVDAFGAGLLGRRWSEVAHISEADGVLGSAEAEEEVRI